MKSATHNCVGCSNRIGSTGGDYADECAQWGSPAVRIWFMGTQVATPTDPCPKRPRTSGEAVLSTILPGTVPTPEELRAEAIHCLLRAKAACTHHPPLPRSRDLQEYWNNRARLVRFLIGMEVFDELEVECGWDTRGGRGRGEPYP